MELARKRRPLVTGMRATLALAIASLALQTVPASAATTVTSVSVPEAWLVDVSPDSSRAYVGAWDGSLAVVNTATEKVVESVSLEYGVSAVAAAPDGRAVYVVTSNDTANKLWKIDTATNTVAGTPANICGGALALTVSADSSKVYMACRTPDYALWVMDAGTMNRASDPIALDGGVDHMITSVDGRHVYMAETEQHQVRVFNTTTQALQTIPLGVSTHPNWLASSPDGKTLYAGARDDKDGGGTDAVVKVIDLASSTTTGTIDLPGASPWGLGITPNGMKLYVAINDRNSVSVVNLGTNQVVDEIHVGTDPEGAAMSPDGNRFYTANYIAGTVSVLDIEPPPGPVVTGVASPQEAWRVAVSPDGSRAYTGGWNAGAVSVIDTATSLAVDTIALDAAFVTTVAVSPDGSRVYATGEAKEGGEKVWAIDTATKTVIKATDIGLGSYGIGITPDGTRLYIACYTTNDVWVIDTATMSSVKDTPITFAEKQDFYDLVVSGDGKYAYTANGETKSVSVINTATNAVEDSISVGGTPVWLSGSPDSKALYVSLTYDGTIKVIDTASNDTANWDVKGTITLPGGTPPGDRRVARWHASLRRGFRQGQRLRGRPGRYGQPLPGGGRARPGLERP